MNIACWTFIFCYLHYLIFSTYRECRIMEPVPLDNAGLQINQMILGTKPSKVLHRTQDIERMMWDF